VFVQIGGIGLAKDHIVAVKIYDTLEQVQVITTVSTVDMEHGDHYFVYRFYREDYHAFMDWWERCADVSKFPNGNGKLHVQVEVTGGVAEVTQCPQNVEVSILDWDNLENGGCPYCGSENFDDSGDPVKCLDCGETWEE
jgi:hypothetical protein